MFLKNFGENIKVIFEISNEKLQKLKDEKNDINFNFFNLNIIKEKYIKVDDAKKG